MPDPVASPRPACPRRAVEAEPAASPAGARDRGRVRPRWRRAALGLAAAALACSGSNDDAGETSATTSASATSASASTSTSASATASTSSATSGTTASETTDGGDGPAGLALLEALGGLWSGPATMTPLGAFPLMNMDFRAADPRTLFGRVDLDAANNLRFGFAVETHGGEDVLVYRNGGYFLGILRDSRTALVEHDAAAKTWRFCHLGMGCDYIDARLSLNDAGDHAILDVKVKGAQHVYWDATRVETRTLPAPFPADDAPVGDGTNPFPEMPALEVKVQWLEPLEVDGQVAVILSDTPCDFQVSCHHSRSLFAAAAAGSTSATLTLDQLHAGAYNLNVILDRNGNIAETGFPDAGDGLAPPNAKINVAAAGTSQASATIIIDF
ncbi:MAG: hypothetical protein R3A79_07215 [Nannocystaceae bacterium]